MKTIERQIEGYSEEALDNFRRRYLYPSWACGKQILVRGVCFACGSDSPRLAREFAVRHLKAGAISFRMTRMNLEDWQRIATHFLDNRSEVSNVAFLLHDLDVVGPELAEAVAEAIDATENVLWMATVHDPRMLLPKLRLPFLVYIGLGETGRMRYLLQDEQSMLIDKGSLKHPNVD